MVALERDGGLYRAALKIRHSEETQLAIYVGTSTWHKRLGHCNDEILKASVEYVHGVNEKDVRPHEKIHCHTCALGKLVQSSRETVTLGDQCAAKPQDRVYTDVLGPIRHLSMRKAR